MNRTLFALAAAAAFLLCCLMYCGYRAAQKDAGLTVQEAARPAASPSFRIAPPAAGPAADSGYSPIYAAGPNTETAQTSVQPAANRIERYPEPVQSRVPAANSYRESPFVPAVQPRTPAPAAVVPASPFVPTASGAGGMIRPATDAGQFLRSLAAIESARAAADARAEDAAAPALRVLSDASAAMRNDRVDPAAVSAANSRINAVFLQYGETCGELSKQVKNLTPPESCVELQSRYCLMLDAIAESRSIEDFLRAQDEMPDARKALQDTFIRSGIRPFFSIGTQTNGQLLSPGLAVNP